MGIFSSLNVPETLDITSSQLLDFLLDVEKTYYDTPYHSFHHAADVVSVLYYILVDLNARQYLDDLDIALVLIAAICHDTGHVSK